MEKAAMPYVGIFQTSTIPGADTSIGVHPLRTEAQEDSHTWRLFMYLLSIQSGLKTIHHQLQTIFA